MAAESLPLTCISSSSSEAFETSVSLVSTSAVASDTEEPPHLADDQEAEMTSKLVGPITMYDNI
jgi:hypothetical protein